MKAHDQAGSSQVKLHQAHKKNSDNGHAAV